MKLGKKALEALQAEIDGRLMPGDELIVAGPVAAEGTAWITKNYHDRLRDVFAERFLEDVVKLPEVYGIGTEKENNKIWKMAEESGASARYLMGEGGFLAALWKMAEASGVGLSADLRSVPIRQETIEICEIFDVNPYKLLSGGSILLGIRGGDAFVQAQRLYHSGQFGIEEIAEKMDVLLEQAVKHIRYNTHFVGVNDLVPGSYDGDPFERLIPGNLSASAEQVVYRKVCIELLQELFDALPKKDRDILGKFYGVFGFEKTSLKEIGMYHMMKESAVEKAK